MNKVLQRGWQLLWLPEDEAFAALRANSAPWSWNRVLCTLISCWYHIDIMLLSYWYEIPPKTGSLPAPRELFFTMYAANTLIPRWIRKQSITNCRDHHFFGERLSVPMPWWSTTATGDMFKPTWSDQQRDRYWTTSGGLRYLWCQLCLEAPSISTSSCLV